MKWRHFLRDRRLELFLRLIALGFIVAMLSVMGVNGYGICYIAALLVLVNGTVMLLEFFRRRAFYNQALDTLERLDRKTLLAQMLERPAFREGELFCDCLTQTNKAMNDTIAQYQIAAKEYREYLEMWIHEVKTPVASARLMIENHPSPITQNIGEEIDQIDAYLEQVLFYARSNTVEKDYVIRSVALREVVNTVARRNASAFIKAKVRLELEEIDRTVHTDPKWLAFILSQLVANAVKYRGEDPVIRIYTRQEGNSAVDLYIEDNGIGIPPQDLPRVFDKGFTGENGRRYPKSTGIGLYLCKKLCSRLGLSISLASQEGQGTRVAIRLPQSAMTDLS